MTAPEKALVDELRSHVRNRGGMSRDAETGEIVLPNGAWSMMLAAADLIEQQDCELTAARAEIERLRETLEPFAKAAADCDVEGDLRIGVVKPADVIWESAIAVSITFGDIERARSALAKEEAGR